MYWGTGPLDRVKELIAAGRGEEERHGTMPFSGIGKQRSTVVFPPGIGE
jgi:hypothetical protein